VLAPAVEARSAPSRVPVASNASPVNALRIISPTPRFSLDVLRSPSSRTSSPGSDLFSGPTQKRRKLDETITLLCESQMQKKNNSLSWSWQQQEAAFRREERAENQRKWEMEREEKALERKEKEQLRMEARRVEKEEKIEAERIRKEEKLEAERIRKEERIEAERIRREERKAEREEAEQQREAAERRLMLMFQMINTQLSLPRGVDEADGEGRR
jgi:hypothetical protein